MTNKTPPYWFHNIQPILCLLPQKGLEGAYESMHKLNFMVEREVKSWKLQMEGETNGIIEVNLIDVLSFIYSTLSLNYVLGTWVIVANEIEF